LDKETRDIEDAVELNDPTLARHVRFDSRYNWKCLVLVGENKRSATS